MPADLTTLARDSASVELIAALLWALWVEYTRWRREVGRR